MSAKICPTCWAVSGKYGDWRYDCISVTPLLAQEKILISIMTENNELKHVADVAFPMAEQTGERFTQLARAAIGKKLLVLI
ncbi:MAG TPA: hypothetical protein VL863_08605 [bacterium]|nr:hypothetical protein [bacterium]